MQDTTGSAAGDLERAAEQQAIRLLQQGNIEGLETLVQAYQVRAVHTAVLITHERQLAEDVVQDAYLQAYRKIAQFDERRPFGPWFLKIVINAARKAAQRKVDWCRMKMQKAVAQSPNGCVTRAKARKAWPNMPRTASCSGKRWGS